MRKKLLRLTPFQKEVLAYLNDIEDRLTRMERKAKRSERDKKAADIKEIKKMDEVLAALDRAEAAAQKDNEADASALGLILTLVQLIRDATAGAPNLAALKERLNTLADGTESRAKALSDAVVANTPAAPDVGGSVGGATPALEN